MIAVIPGNDFELARLEPVIREFESRNFNCMIVKKQGDDTRSPEPAFSSDFISSMSGNRSGTIEIANNGGPFCTMESIEDVFIRHKPKVALVFGDSDYALAAAIVAAKSGARLAHIEAGLRNYDRSDQSEINRIIIDHLSHYLFVPDESARDNLIREGIDEPMISVFGSGTNAIDWWIHNPNERNVPVWIIVTILQSAYHNMNIASHCSGQVSAINE